MSSFLQRFWNVLRGKTGAMLDSLEKPQEQLQVFVSELNAQVQDLQRSVASAIADEKRLEKQIETLRARSSEWEERAILALDGGDEELARSAVEKQEQCDSEADALEVGWRAQQEATGKLKESLKLAKTRTEEARRRYTLLLAQYKSAETRRKIQTTLDSGSSSSSAEMMERLEAKIRSVEAETEAQLELTAGATDVDLEARFHAIDRQRRGDDGLTRLKAKLEERKQLEAGDADPVDAMKRSLDS